MQKESEATWYLGLGVYEEVKQQNVLEGGQTFHLTEKFIKRQTTQIQTQDVPELEQICQLSLFPRIYKH